MCERPKKAKEHPAGANQGRRRGAWQRDGVHGRSVNLAGARRDWLDRGKRRKLARESELRKGLGASRPGQEPIQTAWRGGGSVLERFQAVLPPEARSQRAWKPFPKTPHRRWRAWRKALHQAVRWGKWWRVRERVPS